MIPAAALPPAEVCASAGLCDCGPAEAIEARRDEKASVEHSADLIEATRRIERRNRCRFD